MTSLRFLALAPIALIIACARTPPPTSATAGKTPSQEEILPLVRLRLYASGVGCFERRGDVSAGQHTLPVPMGHLDDALKSLVLLSADSEPLSLSFPSRVSPAVARARAGMAAAENAALSYDRLLAALRGEEVMVTLRDAARLGKTRLTGSVVEVVSVEPSHPSYDHGPVNTRVKKADEGDDEEEEQPSTEEVARLQLILLSEEMGVIRFDVSELVSVRPLDPKIMERFEAAMSARIATRANPTEWLEMAGGNRKLRDLRLGYLAETPIWRASYRLRVPEQGKAELQASPNGDATIITQLRDSSKQWDSAVVERCFSFNAAPPHPHPPAGPGSAARSGRRRSTGRRQPRRAGSGRYRSGRSSARCRKRRAGRNRSAPSTH